MIAYYDIRAFFLPGEKSKGDFMQKWNASLCTAGEEPKHFDRKGRHSVLQRTKKGILALGIAVFAFSSVPSLSALAAPSEQDDILVFSEDGGMVSQEEQTVEIVVEDTLKGDSRTKGQQVVDYASQFIGRPYRYGGLSLLHGSDCSGFLVGVFGHFGISLPHSSGAIRSIGTNVGSLENALPGDILAYSGHVGIYLGEGRMLSALNSRSGVTIESATYKPIKSIRRLF